VLNVRVSVEIDGCALRSFVSVVTGLPVVALTVDTAFPVVSLPVHSDPVLDVSPSELNRDVTDGTMLGNQDFLLELRTRFFAQRRLLNGSSAVVDYLFPIAFNF
jgi:hypothetical protein